jgi:hypothetical protein
MTLGGGGKMARFQCQLKVASTKMFSLEKRAKSNSQKKTPERLFLHPSPSLFAMLINVRLQREAMKI